MVFFVVGFGLHDYSEGSGFLECSVCLLICFRTWNTEHEWKYTKYEVRKRTSTCNYYLMPIKDAMVDEN